MVLPVAPRTARTFASLRSSRNFRLYAAGQGISLTGTWLQNSAEAWLVLQLSHSPAALGALGFWTVSPYVAVGLFGGVLSDRFNRRLMLVCTGSALLVLAGVLAALAWSGSITVWQLYLVAALSGLVAVVDSPTRLAFVAEMVGEENLPNAVALNAALVNVTRIVGPAVAGVFIATVGARLCFALNSLSFAAVIVALLTMRSTELVPVARTKTREPVLRELAEGLRYAWWSPSVRMALVVLLVVATLSINITILLAALAAQTLHGDARVFGVLSACFGVGALLGALLTATLGRATWPLLLASAGGFGVALLVLAPQRALPLVLLALASAGIGCTVYMSTSNALVQLATPGPLQGRVMGLYNYVFVGTALPGALIAGWLTQIGGTTLAYLVGGVAALTMAGVGAARYVGREQVGGG